MQFFRLSGGPQWTQVPHRLDGGLIGFMFSYLGGFLNKSRPIHKQLAEKVARNNAPHLAPVLTFLLVNNHGLFLIHHDEE